VILQAIILAASLLRVCADPNYLPFSNSAGQGFENKIAATVASSLGRKLVYTWESMRSDGGFEQFVHETLNAKRCDLIVDVPYGTAEVSTTDPYYISSYVFVYKKQKAYDLTSMDSPVLHRVKIGYEADTPAEGGLQVRALTPGALPFNVAEHPDQSPDILLDAIDTNRINVAITWEPAIGYYLRQHPDLTIVTVPNTRSRGAPEQYSFPMAMGLRQDEGALRDRLNNVIRQHRSQFDAILKAYGVRFFNAEASGNV
jgi:mxaJ protein